MESPDLPIFEPGGDGSSPPVTFSRQARPSMVLPRNETLDTIRQVRSESYFIVTNMLLKILPLPLIKTLL
jgi:hypothetical protein